MVCFCADAKDAFGGQNREQAFRKPFGNHRKELKFRRMPIEIFSSGPRGALLVQENTRLTAGHAGAAASWPLNVLPNNAQKAASLGHRGETSGVSVDIRKDEQRAVGGLVNFLAFSTIMVLVVANFVVCSFYSFAFLFVSTSASFSCVFFSVPILALCQALVPSHPGMTLT